MSPDQTLQAVVLDVDGTLVDSERDGHRVAFNMAFEEADMPDRWDVERYGELLGVPGGKRRLSAYFEEQGMPEGERDELAGRLHRRKTDIFKEMAGQGQIDARPGVVQLVDELSEAGVRLAVATTGSREWVDPLLEELFGAGRFDAIVGGDEVERRKPDPACYLTAIERLGLGPSEAVAVEDALIGLRAAKAAGLRCVVVVNDYTREQDFDAADLVLDGFGSRDAPVAVLADPKGLDPPGRIDLATLRALAGAA